MRHMSMESLYEYGSRAGLWRVLRIFEDSKLPLTVFGVAMALTRFFVEVVKKETEQGAHLKLTAAGPLLRRSLYALAFPAVVAVIILIERRLGASGSTIIDTLLYVSVAAVFALGFVSSFLLDRQIPHALLRGFGPFFFRDQSQAQEANAPDGPFVPHKYILTGLPEEKPFYWWRSEDVPPWTSQPPPRS